MTRDTTAEPIREVAPTRSRERPIARALVDTLAFARERDYRGWDYCDGLSSAILRQLPFESKWLNLAFQETIKRAPVNLRPLFLVERRRNFKGTGLFAAANLNAHRLELDSGSDPAVDYAAEATALLDWLIDNRCRGYAGFCGSHQHEIQTLGEKGLTTTPSIVSTAYPVRAFLNAAALDPRYPAVARTAADFVVEDLGYQEEPDGATIQYLPTDSGTHFTPNAAAIGARLFCDLYDHFGDELFAERATNILDYVATLQTDLGGWYYRDPPSASHLSMDNFHNGFILEAYLRYREVVDAGRYDDVVEAALEFHRSTLFDPDGAPNWDESRAYPRDIHACAQGVLVFTYAGEFERARRILDWTFDHLYAGDGRFYFRKHRRYTKRITLMRWCQAWMAYATSEYLSAERNPT